MIKKIFLTVLIASFLLLLPACGTQAGQKTQMLDNSYERTTSNRECDRETLIQLLLEYSEGELSESEFVSGAELVCPQFLENQITFDPTLERVVSGVK